MGMGMRKLTIIFGHYQILLTIAQCPVALAAPHQNQTTRTEVQNLLHPANTTSTNFAKQIR